jgi:hypothetical protein
MSADAKAKCGRSRNSPTSRTLDGQQLKGKSSEKTTRDQVMEGRQNRDIRLENAARSWMVRT